MSAQPFTGQALAFEVKAIVNAKIAAGAQFTAFDVTMEVRAKHPAEPVYHEDVKALVRALWVNDEMPGYACTVDVPVTATSTAFMYHPAGETAQPLYVAPASVSIVQQVGKGLSDFVNGLAFWK